MEYLIKKTIPAQLEIVYSIKASSLEEALKNVQEGEGEEIYHDYSSHNFSAATIEVADEELYSF